MRMCALPAAPTGRSSPWRWAETKGVCYQLLVIKEPLFVVQHTPVYFWPIFTHPLVLALSHSSLSFHICSPIHLHAPSRLSHFCVRQC